MTAIQKAREALEAAHRDEIERLTSPFYIRWTSGPDYETAFLCVEDGEPDMNAFAEVSFGQARLFKAALAALDAETEVKATPTEFNQIGMTLAFFASAIKSGENWTDTCQREYDAAQKCLTQLRSALVSPEARS